MSRAMAQAAAQLAGRLELVKKLAMQAKDRDELVQLEPEELWEPADEGALSAYLNLIHQQQGLQPLPFQTDVQ
jgi:hypothetical protein